MMKQTNERFYTSAAWKRKRRFILKRDKYLCQHCKRYGRLTRRTDVHHIKHLDEYPELRFDNDNLISLCRACHNKEHSEKGGKHSY